MTAQFHSYADFHSEQPAYRLLPFRFARIPGVAGRVLITSEAGEHLFLPEADLQSLVGGTLSSDNEHFEDLLAKQFISSGRLDASIRMLATKVRTKKSFLTKGPGLHIFVVTLRCDHSCHYCQVSRRSADRQHYDMSPETASFAVDRLFESRSDTLTVEFQGGEPLLAFPVIRHVVQLIKERNEHEKRKVTFTLTTTLHQATDSILEFMRDNQFQVSVSLDGPSQVHNLNRPLGGADSHSLTMSGIERARAALGAHSVSALTTLTRRSLDTDPRVLIDEYVRLGFRSIFLRPLSPFGFAVRARNRIGYETAKFLEFYERALAYILELNRAGTRMEEVYASILLTHILTPFSSGYVDLRSPAGAALGVLVYNYDGDVYASDESRMLAEMGDTSFKMGSVADPLGTLAQSVSMQVLCATGVAEALPGCSDCAFLPFCGADPIQGQATLRDPVGHRAFSDHCKRHTGLFQILFRYIEEADPYTMRLFLSWVTRRDANVSAPAVQ